MKKTVLTFGLISGGIMAAYIAFGIEPKHLLSAVIMTVLGVVATFEGLSQLGVVVG